MTMPNVFMCLQWCPDKRLGIGKQLMGQMKERYKEYLTIVLVSYEMASEFYIKCGFTHAKDGLPMFLSNAGL